MILQQFPKNCMKFIEKILVSGVGPSPPGSATEVVLLVDPEIQGSCRGGDMNLHRQYAEMLIRDDIYEF